jgi:hypothetical protein
LSAGNSKVFTVRVQTGLLSNAGWIAWIAAVGAATVPVMIWHVRYFRHPGGGALQILYIGLIALAAGLPIYHRLRQRILWRYEPAMLVGLPLLAALIYQTRAALVTLWLSVAAYALGRRVLGRMRLMTPGPLEEIVMATGAGLGLLACVGFILGLAGGYYALVVSLLLGAACFLCAREIPHLWTAVRAVYGQWGANQEMRSGLATLLVVFAALFIVTGSMVALAPSLAYDVLRYHLAEVKVYSGQHAFAVMPFNASCYFPQNAEVLMTLAYSLAGQAAAQMTPPLFYGLALALLFVLIGRCGATPLGALVGVLFAGTLPFVHWTGSVAKNDLALAFFLLAPVYTYVRWRETSDFGWIRLGVFFTAVAAGVKLAAVYALPPLAVFLGIAVWRERRRARAALEMAILFAIFGLFWPARALLLTGNPVYPFSLGASVSNNVSIPSPGWRAALARLIELPWNVHLHGQVYFESLLPYPLGIFFLLFAPVWVLVRHSRANAAERSCLTFAAMFLLYWAATVDTLRFAIAPILLLGGLTGWRIAALAGALPPWTRRCTLGAAAYALALALMGAAIIEVNGPQLRLFAGRLDAAGYLRQALVTYSSLEYLKTRAAPGERIFGIGNCSAAYAPDPAAFDCIPPKDAGSARWLEERLRRNHFRFVIVPVKGAGSQIASPPGMELYRDRAFSVFAVQ